MSEHSLSSTPFADRLHTPHNRYGSLHNRQSLRESRALQRICDVYQHSQKTYASDTVDAAYATADLVRRSLQFAPHTAEAAPLSPEALEGAQETNCHGYTIVASECLEHVGIEHWIGFSNRHSYLLLHDPTSQRLHLIDTPVKELYTEVTGAILGEPLDLTVSPNRRIVRGDVVLERSNFTESVQFQLETPWSFASFGHAGAPQSHDNHLLLAAYAPKEGRNVLHAYANFYHAYIRQNVDDARDHFREIPGGQYPDIDRRNRLDAPSWLVKQLAHRADIADALEVIARVEASCTETDDLWVRLWPLDQKRKLVQQTGDTALLEEVIEGYTQLVEARHVKGCPDSAQLLGKRAAASALAQ